MYCAVSATAVVRVVSFSCAMHSTCSVYYASVVLVVSIRRLSCLIQGLVLHGLRHGGKALPNLYHNEAGKLTLTSYLHSVSHHVLTRNAAFRQLLLVHCNLYLVVVNLKLLQPNLKLHICGLAYEAY